MRQPYLAICDQEEDYAKRLAEFINRKPSIPFRVGLFTDEKTLEEFSRKSKIDLLLIAESSMSENVKDFPVGNILLLDEGSGERYKSFKRIYKYQSADKILKELLIYLSESQMLLHGKNVNKQSAIYSFYSPVNRCLQTSTALHFASALSKRQKVLFINLEAYSTLDTLIDRSFTDSLSDLIYFAGRDIDKFAYRLSSMVVQKDGIDILPPVLSLEDMMVIDKTRWMTFLDNIKETHLYDGIVIDLGEPIQGFLDILGKSEIIYQIEKEDVASKCAIMKFHKLLELTGNQYIEELIRKIQIPRIEEVSEKHVGMNMPSLMSYVERTLMAG